MNFLNNKTQLNFTLLFILIIYLNCIINTWPIIEHDTATSCRRMNQSFRMKEELTTSLYSTMKRERNSYFTGKQVYLFTIVVFSRRNGIFREFIYFLYLIWEKKGKLNFLLNHVVDIYNNKRKSAKKLYFFN